MIAGIEPCSFVDYPGRTAAVLFVQGCNLRCTYCHNRELIARSKRPLRTIGDALSWLQRRVGRLSAVVVSGGEPTLHRDLPQLLARIRSLGFLVKLDTNGTRPEVLRRLLDATEIDYVAMDIKDVPERYENWLANGDVSHAIRESIALLRQTRVAHEFRTTVNLLQHDVESLDSVRALLGNESPWVLQPLVVTRPPSLSDRCSDDRLVLDTITRELRRRGANNLRVRGQGLLRSHPPTKYDALAVRKSLGAQQRSAQLHQVEVLEDLVPLDHPTGSTRDPSLVAKTTYSTFP